MTGASGPAGGDAPDRPAPALPVGNVYVGTCGWTEPTLIASGRFYPPGARSAAARLRHYASRFPLVEVDSTYYAPPSERNARLWVERTPPGFRFDVKAFGLLTHHPAATASLPEAVRSIVPRAAAERERVYLSSVPPAGRDLLWTMHVEALRPLADAGRLGCVLFQFPPWFRCTRRNADYLRLVRERLPWQIAVEFRGGGWLEPERRPATLALLERLGASHVVVDEPQGFRSSTPAVLATTAPLAVVRFHGRNTETWEKSGLSAAERFRYLYSEDELRGWLAPLRRLATQAEELHALLNNCYADCAVRNATELAALLRTAESASPA